MLYISVGADALIPPQAGRQARSGNRPYDLVWYREYFLNHINHKSKKGEDAMSNVRISLLRNMVICVFVIGMCGGFIMQANNAYARVPLSELLEYLYFCQL